MAGKGTKFRSPPVRIDYTNYRGERRLRIVHPMNLIYGSNQWHPNPQWLLECWDVEMDALRVFAMAGIHSWEEPTLTPETGGVAKPPEGA